MKNIIRFLILMPILIGCTTITKSDYITVSQMTCPEVEKTYSKKQLSELTEEEKFVAMHSTECAITFMKVRMRRSEIVGYYPHYSVLMERTDKKYENDPEGPLHIVEMNIENCSIALGGHHKKPIFVVINKTCDELDKMLLK